MLPEQVSTGFGLQDSDSTEDSVMRRVKVQPGSFWKRATLKSPAVE